MSLELLRIETLAPPTHYKLKAVFRITPRDGPAYTKVVRFGGYGYKDYPTYYETNSVVAATKRDHYIARHRVAEEDLWKTNPMAPATLSRYVLWNLPTVEASVEYYRKKFGL